MWSQDVLWEDDEHLAFGIYKSVPGYIQVVMANHLFNHLTMMEKQ